jgi:hypothetical protein
MRTTLRTNPPRRYYTVLLSLCRFSKGEAGFVSDCRDFRNDLRIVRTRLVRADVMP